MVNYDWLPGHGAGPLLLPQTVLQRIPLRISFTISGRRSLHTHTHISRRNNDSNQILNPREFLPGAAAVSLGCYIIVMGWGGNGLHLVLHAIQQDLPGGLHVRHLLSQVLLVVLVVLVFIQQVLPRPLLKLPL